MAKAKKPRKEKRSPMQVHAELTGAIRELMDSKPEREGLEAKLSTLFVKSGLKPNPRNIKRIIAEYEETGTVS